MKINSISVVLPCYNESKAIPKTLSRLLNLKKGWLIKGVFDEVEIIVVNDCSSDDSPLQLSQFSSDIKIINLKKQSGYGAALKAGFEICSTQWVAFYDLDQTCDPIDLPKLTDSLKKNNATLALGNRLNQNSKMPLHRKFGNFLFKTSVNIFLNSQLSDVCTGYRVFDNSYKSLFTNNMPMDLNYSLAMTIVCLKSKLKVVEVDVSYADRVGRSKLNSLFHGFQFLKTIFQYSGRLGEFKP